MACKTQVQWESVSRRQPHGAHEQKSSYGIGMGNSKTIVAAPETFTLMLANTPTPISIARGLTDNNFTTYDTRDTYISRMHADVVVVVLGINFTFVVLLVLITSLTATGYYFMRHNTITTVINGGGCKNTIIN